MKTKSDSWRLIASRILAFVAFAISVIAYEDGSASVPDEDEISAGGKGGRGGRGGGGRGGKRPDVEGGGRGGSENALTRLYDNAIALKEDGECDKAIPILECLVRQETGFEMAAVPLGQCLLDTKIEAHGEEPSTRVDQALFWLTRAADAGDYHAQGFLSQVHIGEHVDPKDPVTAGKWYLLFQRNPVRESLGLSDLPLSERENLYSTLSDHDWSMAEVAARSWQKQWVIEPIPEERIRQENCSPQALRQIAGLKGRGGKADGSPMGPPSH